MKNTVQEKLTEERIQALLEEYAITKDAQIRDTVILQYRNLVESIARRFSGSGEPIEDLGQEGYIGLITATDLYDSSKGVKFSTYATHFIIGQIKHSLRDRGKIIKEPAWLQELNHRITKVIDSLYQELGRQPTESEIGKIMHLPESTIVEMLTTREIFKVSSLDCDQNESAPSGSEVDKVSDDRYTTFHLPVEDKIVLETAMNKLKLIEQKVIQEFYFTGLTQTEIAKKVGISCNYVSHILRSGTKKLRRILTTDELREVQMQLQLAGRRVEGEFAGEAIEVTDSLTGLYNREYLESRLGEEIQRAARDKSEIAFAVISIPGFEEFASKFGAMRRDEAVYNLANMLKGKIRKCDILGRLSESEFGLVMPHTGQNVQSVCDRVSSAVRKFKPDTGQSHISASFEVEIGFAVYPKDAQVADQLMSMAYAALNQVKEVDQAA